MNLEPIVRTLSIAPKAGSIIPFEPNKPQLRILSEVTRAYSEHRPCRLVILKARQMGISTIAEAILFSLCVHLAGIQTTVAAHELESTMKLFGYTRLFYETFPYKHHYPTRFASQNRIVFKNNRSGVHVVTAAKRTAGRGSTIHSLHASEMAFWKYPEETWNAFRRAVPNVTGSIVMIESTAQGVGNFFETIWTDSQASKGEFIPLFFPWYDHYEYIPCHAQQCRDGTCDTCTFHSRNIRPRDEEERELVSKGVTPPQLAWRRQTIQGEFYGGLDLFRQEYPANPEEAFLASGINVFPEPHIAQCFERSQVYRGRLSPDPSALNQARFTQDSRGPLRVYKLPDPDSTYFIGADPCFGFGTDLSAAQVLNRVSKEQVAVFHAKLNPVAFADELARLGSFYNNATIACEVEGPGQATIARLQVIYPHVWTQTLPDRTPGSNKSYVMAGWSTNWRRKAWVLGDLGNTLEAGRVILHDYPTYQELRNYVYAGPNGEYAPAGSGHDDLVMSLAICCLCDSQEPQARHPHTPGELPKFKMGRVAGRDSEWAQEEEVEEAWGQ